MLLDEVAETNARTEAELSTNLGEPLGRLTTRKKAQEAINELLALPRAVRRELADKARADVEFDVADPTFDFSWPTLDSPGAPYVQALFVHLYKDVFCKTGFTGFPGQGAERLSSVSFEAGFREANAESPVCPACMGDLPNRIDKRSAVHREHYFPKSVYAPLALHPLNLVLTCKTCNDTAHRDDDPINPHRPGAVGSILVPYRRDGFDELDLEFEVSSLIVHVTAKSGDGRPSILAFSALYRLDQQWSDRLQTYIHATVFDELVSRTSVRPTTDEIIVELKSQARVSSKGARSRPDARLRLFYVEWLLRNLSAVRAELNRREADSDC